MTERRSVLLISNHPVFREGLKRMLKDEPFDILDQAATVEQAAKLAGKIKPDVIIYDGEFEDQPSTQLASLFDLESDQLVTLSLKDSEMTIFTRRQFSGATLEDLIASISRQKNA